MCWSLDHLEEIEKQTFEPSAMLHPNNVKEDYMTSVCDLHEPRQYDCTIEKIEKIDETFSAEKKLSFQPRYNVTCLVEFKEGDYERRVCDPIYIKLVTNGCKALDIDFFFLE